MWQYREDDGTNRLVDSYIARVYYHVVGIAGLYPINGDGNRIFHLLQLLTYVIVFLVHTVIIMNSTITTYDFNMVLFSQNVHFCLLMQVSIIVLMSFAFKNRKIFIIHRFLVQDLYDYEEPGASGEEALRSLMDRMRRRLNLIPVGAALSAGVVLIVSPIVDFNVGTFDFNITAQIFDIHLLLPYIKYPFYVKDGFGHYFALTGQVVIGFLVSVIIGGAGFVFINISGKVCLHLMILNNSLDNFESRIDRLYSKLFGEMSPNMKSLQHDSRYVYCFAKCLRKNFEHHQVIVKVYNLLEDVATIPMGCSYLAGTIVIALSLISAGSASINLCFKNLAKELPGTSFAAMMMCIVEVGYMFLFSVMGQQFIDLSAELRYKMYSTRWYMCSGDIKKSLIVFQESTLKPITLTAGWIIPANMETFTTVMNAAYSYYNLVNALGKK